MTAVDAFTVPGAEIVALRPSSSVALYRIRGAVDLSNARLVRDVVRSDLSDSEDVVLDLEGVDFFGTAALSVVADLDEECNARGRTLTTVDSAAVTRCMTAARWQPVGARSH